ncbi:hypothetical protein BD309DRAFT_220415 [Dichomitus squalens]|uniref:Uncharacterized protein n=1 Tax=Dichomitus squalens TaxID=114155 RepID=A0A4Q9Q2F4_9APHY|nr:hypothetical protein BD309DRAFT_220415 [Dichomitus squalens]TBU61417.1 hypothetical protein BD310DRAFT_194725 [Dichomitus squalens]
MPLTIPEPHPSGVVFMNVASHSEPGQASAPPEQSQLQKLPPSPFLQPLPISGSRCSSPGPSFPYADLATTSGASDTTCHSPTMTAYKPGVAENVVRLIPIFDHVIRPALRMDITFCEASQLFLLQNLDGRQVRMTMGQILRRYSPHIASIDVDATGLPNPSNPKTMACAVVLPFTPDAVASEEEQTCSHISGHSLPILPALEHLSVTTSRALSIRTLLKFLQYTPLLKTLTVTNGGHHQAILPDDVAKIKEPNLPYLEHVSINGLLTHTVEQLLNKLSPSINLRTTVQVHFQTPSFPAFKADSVLHTLLVPVRHAHLSYVALGDRDNDTYSHALFQPDQTQGAGGSKSYTDYLFSFSDDMGRVQLHWHWSEERGATPYLGHISLATRSLVRVRTVSLALYNVRPSAADLRHVLQSFSALAHVHLHVTQPEGRPGGAWHVHGDPSGDSSDSASYSGSCPGHVPLTSQHGEFSMRAAHVVRRIADVTTLFAFGLAQRLAKAQSQCCPCTPAHGGALDGEGARGCEQLALRLAPVWYRPLWALMVRKPVSGSPRSH